MSRTKYFLQISVAKSAGELHGIRRQASVDAELDAAARAEVAEAIGRRFSQLNAAALPVATPRWG